MCGDQVAVEGADQGGQVLLLGEVELDALAGGDPQGAVAHRPGQLVEGQVPVRCQHPAGDTGPDHADVVEGKLGLGALAPDVAVVLGVDPVKLEELGGVGAKAVRIRSQLLGEPPA
jgi:hypothetical protein